MRHLALLGVVYLLAASLVLPGSLLASGQPQAPADTGRVPDLASAKEPAMGPAESEPERPGAQGPDGRSAPGPLAEQPAGAPEPAAAEPDHASGELVSAPEAPAAAPDSPPSAAPAPGAQRSAPAARRDEREAGGRARAAADTTVTIRDFEFSPKAVTIAVGDTVTWRNEGPTPHSATADDGSFDTGIYDAGESRSETFEKAGTFSYFCTPHPFMKASVTVRASGAGGESGSGSEDESPAAGGAAGGAGTSAAGSDAGSGEALPATGRDSGSLLMLGLLMLALGVAVQRRSREQAARPAGRIGG